MNKYSYIAGLDGRMCEVVRKSGLTIKDFSKKVGINCKTMYRIMYESQGGSVGTLYKICSRMGISADWLLFGEKKGGQK